MADAADLKSASLTGVWVQVPPSALPFPLQSTASNHICVNKVVNKLSFDLLTKFLDSRRQGLSPNTIDFYKTYLIPFVNNCVLTPESINYFISTRSCGLGGKHAYYRAIRAFVNWLVRYDYITDNPMKRVDPPKPAKPILPSLTVEQVHYLIDYVADVRDKAIISLFADSGMRLSELTNIRSEDIDWERHTITIWGKGNKQRRAPFKDHTASLLKQVISANGHEGNIWHLEARGIEQMLSRLSKRT